MIEDPAVTCSGFLLAFGTLAWAQAIGQLTGVIRDDTGGVLPGASLTISGVALSAPRTVLTDEHGKYEIQKLLGRLRHANSAASGR